MVKQAITDMGPKAVRMSVVALTSAVLVVFWGILDEVVPWALSPVLVSGFTALIMLVAQFMDHKALISGVEIFDGDTDG